MKKLAIALVFSLIATTNLSAKPLGGKPALGGKPGWCHGLWTVGYTCANHSPGSCQWIKVCVE